MSTSNKVSKFISGFANPIGRFNKGFADTLTMGMTDFDKRGDSPFQRDIKGIVNPVMNYFAGGTPMSEADYLRRMNGQTFNNPPIGNLSMHSPGDQQLTQRQVENAKTSVGQKAAQFLTMMKSQGM